MKNLTPYLMFNGNCEEALNFYKESLEGEITFLSRYKDSPMQVPPEEQEKIMHATLHFWGGDIMASDNIQSAEYTTAATGSSIHLSLGFEDPEHIRRVFSCLSTGGKITMPPRKQFWGSEFGMLTDKFGIHWMFSYGEEKEK